jgi:hypothetical protein
MIKRRLWRGFHSNRPENQGRRCQIAALPDGSRTSNQRKNHPFHMSADGIPKGGRIAPMEGAGTDPASLIG